MSIARTKSSHEAKEEYSKSILLYYRYRLYMQSIYVQNIYTGIARCTTNQVTILALFYRIKENIKPVLS